MDKKNAPGGAISTDFTQGGILKPLLRFSGPVFLALFLQAMYGAVDLLIVGRFGAASGVSAVATGSQLMHTLTSIVAGLSMGVTILLGQRIGEGRLQQASSILGTAIVLFATLGVALGGGMALFARGLALLLRAPAEALEETVLYVVICALGAPLIVAYNVLGSVFRGLGNSKLPLFAVSVACLCNIIGDLLLVGRFGLGAAGAALATVASQGVSVLLALLLIRRQGLPFPFGWRWLRPKSAEGAQILRFGVPIALQGTLTSLSFMGILSILNSLGLVASAGAGIAEKVTAFIMLIPAAFMSSLSAFVAQNVGAKKPERAKKALYCGVGASLACGALMFVLCFWRGELLAGIFTRDAQVIRAAADYLHAYAIDCLLVSFVFCFTGYCNGRGETLLVMAQGIGAAFCVRLPAAWLLSRISGGSLFIVGLATPIASAVQIAVYLCYFFYKERATKKDAVQPA